MLVGDSLTCQARGVAGWETYRLDPDMRRQPQGNIQAKRPLSEALSGRERGKGAFLGARRVKKRRASKVVQLDLRMPSLHRCWGNKAVSEVRAGLSSKRCTPEASPGSPPILCLPGPGSGRGMGQSAATVSGVCDSAASYADPLALIAAALGPQNSLPWFPAVGLAWRAGSSTALAVDLRNAVPVTQGDDTPGSAHEAAEGQQRLASARESRIRCPFAPWTRENRCQLAQPVVIAAIADAWRPLPGKRLDGRLVLQDWPVISSNWAGGTCLSSGFVNETDVAGASR
ncbi:hypothetical protein IQ07DRAFT_598853 [Pyrenochaeta sp. DS3sAY3a]|nr:hypothetical protein IQ07DRAFT_598853 [Pyrenochaeta sp. DS3sAY3a]